MSHTHTFLYVIHSKTPSEQVLFRGCCKSCFDTFTYQPLFPLNKSNISSHLYGAVSSTKNGRAVTWRHVATLNWDNAAPFCETQNELRGVEFHFCPSNEKGRVEQPNPPLLCGLVRYRMQATSNNCKAVDASGLHMMSPTCTFAE